MATMSDVPKEFIVCFVSSCASCDSRRFVLGGSTGGALV